MTTTLPSVTRFLDRHRRGGLRAAGPARRYRGSAPSATTRRSGPRRSRTRAAAISHGARHERDRSRDRGCRPPARHRTRASVRHRRDRARIRSSSACRPRRAALPHELAAQLGIEPLWLGSVAQLNCVSVAAGIETVRALMRRYPQLDAALVVVRPRVRRGLPDAADDGRADGAAAMLIARNSTKNWLGGIAIETHAKWHRGSTPSPRTRPT